MAEVLPEPPPPSNRGLWMLVIGLGIAILLVLAAMIGMAIKQAVFDPKPLATATATLQPGEVPELNLDLAPGTTVAETRMDGHTLIVRLSGPDSEEILILDPAKQKVLSRVRFNKKAP
ncbi:MAG: hypothetical protein K8S25_14920 [Alphaproteobacteria bacterium]|nr:hypothetical protein [Alphaproteobacteria bacterium]